jgi:hypothetical protein
LKLGLLAQEQLLEKDTSILVLESTFPEKEAQLLKGFKLDKSNNYRAIRYADVLLMAAEALTVVD